MAENSNVLHLDSMNYRVSNANDLNVTAVSEVFEVANHSSNASFQRLEIESEVNNISQSSVGNLNTNERPTDPNSNVSLGEFDLSLTETFARMKLQSDNDSFGHSFETSRVAEDSHLPGTCSPKTLQGTMTSSEDVFLQQNSKSPLTSGETSLCPETNPPYVEETATPLEGNVSGQDVSNNNLLDDAVILPQDKELQNTSDSPVVASPPSASKLEEPEVSSKVSDSISLPSTELSDPGHKSAADGIVLAENPDSSFSNQPVESAELVDNHDSVVIPVDNVLDNPDFVSSNLPATVESTEPRKTNPDSIEVLNSSSSICESKLNNLPLESTEPKKTNADSSEVLNSSSLICESKLSNLSLESTEPKKTNADSIEVLNSSSLICESKLSNLSLESTEPKKTNPDSSEVLNSSSPICESKLSSDKESIVLTKNQNLSSIENYPVKSTEPINSSCQDAEAGSCKVSNSDSLNCGSKLAENQDLNNLSYKSLEVVECLDSVQALTEVNNADKDLFKVPALPQKYTEPKPISCLDVSEQELLDQSISFHTSPGVSSEVSTSSPSTTIMDLVDDLSKHAENGKTSLSDAPTVIKNICMSPESISANLKDFSNPLDLKDDLFKVPEQPQDEDEMFTDAVQFFKDPSSFQFLERIPTCSTESDIPRSSLYVAFDPLHSKILPGSQMQGLPFQPQRPEAVVSEVKPRNNGSVILKHFTDASVRESMGNVLISFDSPKVAQSSRMEEMPGTSVVPKLYTEEELQQALKMNELSLQEMYLRQHRELEQEMTKLKEDNKVTIEKLTFLCKTQKFTIEELLAVANDIQKIKVEAEEKLDVAEKEKEKLEKDLKASNDDLQTTETMFADFHKRYEQCKSMLKTYKENEVHLKEAVEQWKTKLTEQEQKYNVLQERTEEILEKANSEVASAKKSCDGQVTVLKAQLKKAELKISGLESDIKQVKIENSKLGGICDDLMARVSEG